MFKIRDGVTDLRWETWPRIDEAIASYERFQALRDEGVVPAGLRFQVGLPFPVSALNGFKANFAADYPVAARIRRPRDARAHAAHNRDSPADLAIQWDVCYEVLDIEGVIAWTAEGAWERFTDPVARLTPLIPDDVLVGYHLGAGRLE